MTDSILDQESALGLSYSTIGTTDRTAISNYKGDYFSGCDIRIFIGDLWVDDIITMQYSINSAKNPRYSYGDEYYKVVAKGNILVEGSFTIAYKEWNYLPSIIERYMHVSHGGSQGSPRFITNKESYNAFMNDAKPTPVLGGLDREGQSGKVVSNPFIQYKTLEDVLDNLLSSPKTQESFEHYLSEQEDKIWGVGEKARSGVPGVGAHNIDLVGRRDRNGVTYDHIGKGFDIVVSYGDYNVGYSAHTLQAINDIHITSVSQVHSPNGDPVAEVYTFFGKDIGRSITDRSSDKTELDKFLKGSEVFNQRVDFKPGNIVNIIRGPFKGAEGYVHIVGNARGANIQLPTNWNDYFDNLPGGYDYVIKIIIDKGNYVREIDALSGAPGFRTPQFPFIPQYVPVLKSEISLALNQPVYGPSPIPPGTASNRPVAPYNISFDGTRPYTGDPVE
jgi:hypothetical protein